MNARAAMAATGILCTLAACGSAPTRLYTLAPAAPAARVNYGGPPLRVDAVHIPPALDRIELVRNLSGDRIHIDELDHWSAPLGEEARQALSADLAARLPSGQVIFPHLPKPDGAAGLTVDVLTFRAGRDGASLQASWVIETHDPQGLPAERRESVTLQSARPIVDDPDVATAWGALLGALADRVAQDLTATTAHVTR